MEDHRENQMKFLIRFYRLIRHFQIGARAAQDAVDGVRHDAVARVQQRQRPDQLFAGTFVVQVKHFRELEAGFLDAGQDLDVAGRRDILLGQEVDVGVDEAQLERQADAGQRAQDIQTLVAGLARKPNDDLVFMHHFHWSSVQLEAAILSAIPLSKKPVFFTANSAIFL